MKPTQKNTVSYVKQMLASNKVWATKALVRIYQENQTQGEQIGGVTTEDNGRGFSGIDAAILSSFSKQIIGGRTLSDKQMAIVLKKMPRYSRQVIEFSNKEKLIELVMQTTQ